MSEQTKSDLRTLLKLIGSALVTRGVIKDTDSEALAELAVGLIVIGWGWWMSRRTHTIQEPPQQQKQ